LLLLLLQNYDVSFQTAYIWQDMQMTDQPPPTPFQALGLHKVILSIPARGVVKGCNAKYFYLSVSLERNHVQYYCGHLLAYFISPG
jgi:hypothetical protein